MPEPLDRRGNGGGDGLGACDVGLDEQPAKLSGQAGRVIDVGQNGASPARGELAHGRQTDARCRARYQNDLSVKFRHLVQDRSPHAERK